MTDFIKLDRTNELIRDLSKIERPASTFGGRLAERIVAFIGSWRFILIQTTIVIVWGSINIVAWFEHWDPYPFILLNLFLSIQAAYAAPVVMMGQNRQAARDRVEAHNDFLVNIKAEEEILSIIEQMKHQEEKIDRISQMLVELKNKS